MASGVQKLLTTRRASASAGSANGASASAPRVTHRSNDSHHALAGQPSTLSQSISATYTAAAGSSTPQQKVVQTLINRMKHKLPCNSGLNLTFIESDHALQQTVESLVDLSRHSLDIIAYGLSELLEKLSKQTDPHGHRTIDVLQSHLFILKVLSVAMAHRWSTGPRNRDEQRPGSQLGQTSTGSNVPDTGTPPASPAFFAMRHNNGHKPSLDQLSTQSGTSQPSNDPLPLDDAAAKYIMSVMLLFLRQTYPEGGLRDSENLRPGASMHDFESIELDPTTPFSMEPFILIPNGAQPMRNGSSTSINSTGGASIPLPRSSFVFKPTPSTLANSSLSLNMLIAKFAGHVIYHLSVSNWPIVFARIRVRIHFLASTQEESPDTTDLRVLTYCALDRQRLMQVLQELSSLLVNMKRESQHAVSIVLRTAIWNWIEVFPQEYNDTVTSQRRLDGAPERVFDLLFQISDPTSNRVIWPTLMVLMCISPERIKQATQTSTVSRLNKKEAHLIDQLHKHAASPQSKLMEIAVGCQLDMCRAAIRIRPENDCLQKSYAGDLSDEINARLWKVGGHRPFWELQTDIDIALYADALVSVFRFLTEEESLPVFRACLEPERSDAVKICAVRACLTLVLEAPRLPSQPPLRNLYACISTRIRRIFSNAALRKSEVDSSGNIKRANPRPNARRFTNETITDRELLLLAIMALCRTDITFFFVGFSDEADLSAWIYDTAQIFQRPNDSAIRISATRTFSSLARSVLMLNPGDEFYLQGVMWIKHATSMALVNLSTQLLDAREDFDEQRSCVTTINSVLSSWTRISHLAEHREWQMSAERVDPLALCEIALLVSLTSGDTDVVQKAANGLRKLCLIERQVDAPQNRGLSEQERQKRHPIYDQLTEKKATAIGRVKQQKDMRWNLRDLANSAPVYVAIWEEVYFRWCYYNDILLSSDGVTDEDRPLGDNALSDELKRQQWQNLTLFLASFGAACLTEGELSLTGFVTPRILPDRLRVLRPPEGLLLNFLNITMNILMFDDPFLSGVAKEALGAELSPKLLSRLFAEINRQLDLTKEAKEKAEIGDEQSASWNDSSSLVVDQLVGVLKLLLERPSTDEVLVASEMISIVLSLAQLVDPFSDTSNLRARAKLCSLCDILLSRLDYLVMRKEDEQRAALLDVLIDWLQDPAMCLETEHINDQKELNLYCLRSVAKLLGGLRLQPLEELSPDDVAHTAYRMYNRYASSITKVLEFQPEDSARGDQASVQSVGQALPREVELRALVIDALANLHLANLDFGFKQFSVNISETDKQKRSVFLSVSARVLGVGYQIEPVEEPVVVPRRSRLCELVRAPDNILALAICETCPPSEVEMVIPVLLNVFDTRSSLVPFLRILVDREIAQTDSPAQIFRGNTMCTRMLSAVAKTHGYAYLRSLILPLIKTMTAMPPGGSYELDPAKAVGQDVAQNQRNVELVASSFIEIIGSSVSALPPMFHEICAYIAMAVYKEWPESKYAGMGAFMFLRFISPGIVSPDIVDVEIPSGDGGVIRRGLMVIAKIVQNLANNIFFGKEQHMIPLNLFLEANVVNVMRYLHDIEKHADSALEPTDEETDELGSTSLDETDTIVLQRFFERHTDKIGKELLSTTKPNSESDPAAIGGKRAWDTLCAAIVDLGAPPEIPKLTLLRSSEMREYLAFMDRCRGRDVKAIEDIVFLVPSTGETAIISVVMNRIDVYSLDIELLLHVFFEIITSPENVDRPYDIVLDFSAFTTSSEIPLHWSKRCIELFPSDLRDRLQTIHILNPNAAAHRYIRKLYNISGSLSQTHSIRAYMSVSELLSHLKDDNIDDKFIPTVFPSSVLETEDCEIFEEVSLRFAQQPRMVVRMEVRETHVRITAVKAQHISPTLSSKSTEIIHYSEINDVYNVSTGQDPHEFIIRSNRMGGILYFSSIQRDQIVRSVRAAKNAIKIEPRLGTERFQRLSNIIATLLHLSMRDITHEDSDVRIAAFDLLSAACSYLGLTSSGKLPSRTAFIAGHPPIFVNTVSAALTTIAPRYTLEFVTEVIIGMDKTSAQQQMKSLQYLSPWMKNLAVFPAPSSKLYEHSGARLRECVRTLIQYTLRETEIFPMIQQYIWAEISKLDPTLVNIVLDELIRAAIDTGPDSKRFELIAETTASLASINVRGRLLVKLRKILGKTSLRPTRTLPENVQWNELACLIRLVLAVGYHHKPWVHNQLFAPEIIHTVTILAGAGQRIVRTSVYGVFMCFLQALINNAVDEQTITELRLVSETAAHADTLQLFGIQRSFSGNELVPLSTQTDQAAIDDVEKLAIFLLQVLEKSAGTKGLLNVWRARWMSLATSMAFQLSPPVQARSFVIMGVLASSDVDDDLFYQMLVAFKNALLQSSETNTFLVVCMLRSFSNAIQRLQENSRYLVQVFWLAVALLQSAHIAFYIEALGLLQATLITLDACDAFKENGVAATLLEGRETLEGILGQLDQLLGVAFDVNFSFSLSAIILKGSRHTTMKATAETALRHLLRVTAKDSPPTALPDAPGPGVSPDALGYFTALIPYATTPPKYAELLKLARVDAAWAPQERPAALGQGGSGEMHVQRIPFEMLAPADAQAALLLASFVSVLLASSQGDDAETEILYNILSDAAEYYPDVIALLYEGLQDNIRHTFANSSSPGILAAASTIFRIAVQDPTRALSPRGSSSTLSTVDEAGSTHGAGRNHLAALDEFGMAGLAAPLQFLPLNSGQGTKMINWIAELVLKIIE